MDTLYKILDIGTNSNGVHVAKMCLYTSAPEISLVSAVIMIINNNLVIIRKYVLII